MVQLASDEGETGWGEAAPEKEITGDDFETAYDVIDKALRAKIVGKKIENDDGLEELLSSLAENIGNSATAVAAVDIALHDLWFQAKGIPIYEHFTEKSGAESQQPEPLRTSISIGIMELDKLLEKVSTIIDSGSSTIKLKIGRGIGPDLELVKAVRERFGDDLNLSLDANQGYSAADALNLFEKLAPLDIEFIEQPVPADDLPGLRKLYEESPIPVMADEAVCSFEDLKTVMENGICDRVNLKLMKSGGLFQLNGLIRFCEEHDIDCQIGCMIETPVGISAGVHLGLSNRSVKWTDLDGHLFLGDIGHIFSGLETRGDLNILTGGSGLGILVNDDGLSDYMMA
jgi:o-succinylbenzoate synthase